MGKEIAAQNQADGIMALIDRVSSDPDYDINKLEKMMELYTQERDRAARDSYMRALSECQAELPAVVRDAENKQTSSAYATLDAVNRAVVPVITRHGFSLAFGEDESTVEGSMRVICTIGHRDGHSTTGHHIDVPMDIAGIKGNANKTATHAKGSTSTYGRRYLTMMMFNVTLGSEDDDGNIAGGEPVRQLISVDQHNALLDLMKIKGRDAAQVLALTHSKFGEAPETLGMLFVDQAEFATARLEGLKDMEVNDG